MYLIISLENERIFWDNLLNKILSFSHNTSQRIKFKRETRSSPYKLCQHCNPLHYNIFLAFWWLLHSEIHQMTLPTALPHYRHPLYSPPQHLHHPRTRKP